MLLYHAATTGQRRTAWLLAIIAVLFSVMALWSAIHYTDLRDQADAATGPPAAQPPI